MKNKPKHKSFAIDEVVEKFCTIEKNGIFGILNPSLAKDFKNTNNLSALIFSNGSHFWVVQKYKQGNQEFWVEHNDQFNYLIINNNGEITKKLFSNNSELSKLLEPKPNFASIDHITSCQGKNYIYPIKQELNQYSNYCGVNNFYNQGTSYNICAFNSIVAILTNLPYSPENKKIVQKFINIEGDALKQIGADELQIKQIKEVQENVKNHWNNKTKQIRQLELEKESSALLNLSSKYPKSKA